MLKKFTTLLATGQDWHNTYKKKIELLTNVKVKNDLLYQELEKECKRKNGILTFAEYVVIDQFGQNGYYATSKKHGKTDVEKRWGGALANYCKLNGFDLVIEFGCGKGELGVAIAKAYKKQTGKTLKWIGVEIDKKIHEEIFDTFTRQNMQSSVSKIVTALDELNTYERDTALIVFPYSLDNIPPQVFLNTDITTSYPNALLGITAKNGMLSEVIIPPEILKQKGIKLENGFFRQNGITCKLSSWRLRPGQRAYITTDSFMTLYTYIKKFNNKSHVIIIDEFRNEPWFFNLSNLGIPKSLYEKNLIYADRMRYYRESGEHNLYYPIYKNTLLQFLNAAGFQSIDYDAEQKKAAQLKNKLWIPTRENYATLAFIAKNLVNKKSDILPITFSPQRII
jgi:hypothetical protein